MEKSGGGGGVCGNLEVLGPSFYKNTVLLRPFPQMMSVVVV